MPRNRTSTSPRTNLSLSGAHNTTVGHLGIKTHDDADQDSKRTSDVSDPSEKRRAQNRIAQRKHRDKLKRKLEMLEQYVRIVSPNGLLPDADIKRLTDQPAFDEGDQMQHINGPSLDTSQKPLLRNTLHPHDHLKAGFSGHTICQAGFRRGKGLFSHSGGSIMGYSKNSTSNSILQAPVVPCLEELGMNGMYLSPWDMSYAALAGLEVPHGKLVFSLN